jgi:hypothetical protein
MAEKLHDRKEVAKEEYIIMMTMRFKDKIVGDQLPISEVADVLV